MDDLITEFIAETSEELEVLDKELVELESDPSKLNLIDDIFRAIHGIKGTCGFFGLTKLAAVAHASEEIVSKIRSKQLAINPVTISMIFEAVDVIKNILIYISQNSKEPENDYSGLIQRINEITASSDLLLNESQEEWSERENTKSYESSSSIRVSLDGLEKLTQTVTELVLNRNELVRLDRESHDSEASLPIHKLNAITSMLQEAVMETRLQSISHAWSAIPRMVRDLSQILNKKVKLVMTGESTRLDKQLIEAIREPIVHMVRNSLSHGIESAQERLDANKPIEGVITLNAYHENGHVVIEISDDGRGISLSKIKAKILRDKLASPGELVLLSDAQIIQYIFRVGFSTAEAVTDISGRGFGMDVIKNNIENMHGAVEIKSIEGKGLTVTITIPLTLAIMSVLLVQSSGQRFAIPQINITQVISLKNNLHHHLIKVHGQQLLQIRGDLLPCITLARLLNLSEAQGDFVVVCNVRGLSYGIIVDKIEAIEEIVLNPLAKLIKQVGIYSGNSLLANGEVVMLLNPNGLSKDLIKLTDARVEPQLPNLRDYLIVELTEGKRAIALEKVSFLKEVDIKGIEKRNGAFILRDGDHIIALYGEAFESGKQSVVIIKKSEANIGLLVNKIINISNDIAAIEIIDCDKIMEKA